MPAFIAIHGDQNDIVLYTQAVRLHAALDKTGVPNQLTTIHGAKYDGFNRQVLIDSFSAIREFLRKNNILKKE